MQTARRTRTSVAGCRENHIRAGNAGQHLARYRLGRIGLAHPQEFAHAVLLLQQVRDMIEEPLGADLRVVDHANDGPFEGLDRRGKAQCLSLMDQVQDRGIEFLITKHNQPVARLVPVLDEAEGKFIGRGAGMLAVTGDIVSPIARRRRYRLD